MSLSLDQLAELPSPFYRVAAKAIIKDDQDRLLMVFSKNGNPEIPGGGIEHGETVEECLRREIQEELGVDIAWIGQPIFTYASKANHGWHAFRIALPVRLASTDFAIGDDMSKTRYLTRQELLDLEYNDMADDAIRTCVDKIWSR